MSCSKITSSQTHVTCETIIVPFWDNNCGPNIRVWLRSFLKISKIHKLKCSINNLTSKPEKKYNYFSCRHRYYTGWSIMHSIPCNWIRKSNIPIWGPSSDEHMVRTKTCIIHKGTYYRSLHSNEFCTKSLWYAINNISKSALARQIYQCWQKIARCE